MPADPGRSKVQPTSLFSETGPDIQGDVTAEIIEISAFSALAGSPLGGAVNLGVQFTAAPLAGTFDVTGRGTGHDLSLNDKRSDAILSGTTNLEFRAARDESGIDATLSRLENAQANLSGRADLASGSSRLTLEGSLAETSLLLDGLTGPVTLALEATEDQNRDWSITANVSGEQARIAARGRASELYETPRISGQATAAFPNISAFSKVAGQSLAGSVEIEIDGESQIDFSAFDLAVEIDGTGMSFGPQDLDRLLGGTLSARLNATGSASVAEISRLELTSDALTASASGEISKGASRLDLDARLRDLAAFAPGFPGALTLSGRIEETGPDDLKLDLDATGPGGTSLTIRGSARSDLTSADLGFTGQAPLSFANRFIAPNALSGRAMFDLQLSGSPSVENLRGRISAPGARMSAPEAGIALNDVDMSVDLDNGNGTVAIEGAISEGGNFSLGGQTSLSEPYSSRLSLVLRQAVISDPRLFRTDVNGTIAIEGPLAGGASILGNLALGTTEVRIPSSGLGGANAIPEIVHLNEPPPVRGTRRRAGLLGQAAAKSGGPDFPLDLRINAPNQIFVRGRGLDSEFGGALRLRGSTRNVAPDGGFQLIRGRLDILGRRLELDRAQITMRGTFDPWIDLRASTQAEEYLVTVSVIGPADNPDITFTSTPELPQEEVLARLIFGRGLETLSPLQAARLALAVRTLAGRGGEGVVGKIRNNTGLADLDVTTSDDGNTAVRAGAYLGENLYTDVTVDSAGETRLHLNLDISPSVTVKGGLANDGDSSIGIFFEKDY